MVVVRRVTGVGSKGWVKAAKERIEGGVRTTWRAVAGGARRDDVWVGTRGEEGETPGRRGCSRPITRDKTPNVSSERSPSAFLALPNRTGEPDVVVVRRVGVVGGMPPMPSVWLLFFSSLHASASDGFPLESASPPHGVDAYGCSVLHRTTAGRSASSRGADGWTSVEEGVPFFSGTLDASEFGE